MKTFENCAAQGELRITRVSVIPANVEKVNAENKHFIVGHSETGHHHVLLAERAQVFRAKDAPDGMSILYVILDAPNELQHLRSHDTHETIGLQPGMYEIRSGREFDPYAELSRKQAD